MRQLTVKWETSCKRCGAALEVGKEAMYEKSMGLFCIGHEPKTVEEIREYRTIKAEAKAAKYEEWAGKREKKAEAQLNSFPTIRHDWAFITQPGHIPFRERMNRSDDRACESLKVAQGFREKAASILNVRVAGDAERKRQELRDHLDTLISKGSRVYDWCFGDGTVIQVCKKSYRIAFDRGCTYARDKSYVIPAEQHKTKEGVI
jgi:hypothetical protein